MEKKRTMKKDEFDAYLDEYVRSKHDILKELGIADFIKKINTAEVAKEEQKRIAVNQTLGAAL